MKQNISEKITIGEKYSFVSETLGEERSYWVYLPESYNGSIYASKRYPVLYLLDGDAHFHSASGVVQFMSAGINCNIQIPELIVVAIPNTNRTRDLTPTHVTTGADGKECIWMKDSGGGNSFLQFIREELFHRIEIAYRTLPYRILVGHSLGGLLALHALMEAREMFQAYIAIDPSFSWDDKEIVRRAESWVKEAKELHCSLYITTSDIPEVDDKFAVLAAEVMKTRQAFTQLMESVVSSNFRCAVRHFEDEDHGSVPLLSLYHGLLYIFECYKPPFIELVKETSFLNPRFERISERLGVTLLPPEGALNEMGCSMLSWDEPGIDKVIELFKINVANYPDSFNAYDSLGEAYIVKNEKALAIECYEKSLELNPDNENAKKRLKELGGENEQK